jgi:eukaryotic-like serine/threonine-protein kinase
MPLQPDTRLGRYEIRSLLGTGGMGEVYLAQDTQLRRQVAIKLLPADVTQNKVRLSRFEREAYAASSLNHPNILTIHEIGEQERHHFIATEYIEGESLRQRMARSPLELREVLDVAQQVASALAAAHQAGIVHRDIKPENIMLRRDGFVKVLDFGLAKLVDETQVVAKQEEIDTEAPTKTRLINTEPGVVLGTANYMSPEQARGQAVDVRSDIWSLGVMLYEMVSGRLPFGGPTTTDMLSMILHREPPSLLLYRSDMPAELDRIVEKALMKEREERYQLAKDLGLDLKRLKQRLEMEAESERSITPEEEARRAIAQPVASSRGPAKSGATQAAAAARTGEASAAHTESSAEYVVGEIKRHKRGALLVLAALVIAAAVAAFGYVKYFGSRSQVITSIAVLPFTNVGTEPNTEYLSDGLSESLIDKLSQLPGMKVIARSSSFKYKGKEVDPQEVGTALGVQAILSGRVTQRGDQLQVRAELIDAREKTQLWGEQYNRPTVDIQAVQEEIARTISEKLRVRLTGAQEQQVTKRATQNPEAYQLYLNGLFYDRKKEAESLRKALDYYQQAIALDRNFALAYSGMSSTYTFLAEASVLEAKEALSRSKTAAMKALELDETLADAHWALANVKANEWDWAGAENQYKRAIELNPSLAVAHYNYAYYLACMERYSEALAEIKRAQELDPLNVHFGATEGFILLFARRYDEAIQRLQTVIKTEPDNPTGHVFLGYTYASKRLYPEAIAEYQKFISLEESTSVECYLGYAYAMSGKRSEALALLQKLKATKEYVSPAELAVLYAGLGDKEGALGLLEKAYEAHDLQLRYLKVEQHYDSLRSDPRFVELMRKVGLPP